VTACRQTRYDAIAEACWPAASRNLCRKLDAPAMPLMLHSSGIAGTQKRKGALWVPPSQMRTSRRKCSVQGGEAQDRTAAVKPHHNLQVMTMPDCTVCLPFSCFHQNQHNIHGIHNAVLACTWVPHSDAYSMLGQSPFASLQVPPAGLVWITIGNGPLRISAQQVGCPGTAWTEGS
jgi:hypothetical protein